MTIKKSEDWIQLFHSESQITMNPKKKNELTLFDLMNLLLMTAVTMNDKYFHLDGRMEDNRVWICISDNDSAMMFYKNEFKYDNKIYVSSFDLDRKAKEIDRFYYLKFVQYNYRELYKYMPISNHDEILHDLFNVEYDSDMSSIQMKLYQFIEDITKNKRES